MEQDNLPQLPDFSELWQETLGWQPNEEQQTLFQQLYTQILLANRQFNLTRITEPEEFWEKHLWDSLKGIAASGLGDDSFDNQRIIDIGTGAGFPGLPIAIAYPTTEVTLLDSTRKKIAFLQTLSEELGITNTIPLAGRSEEMGQHPNHRESYDLALARALGSASVCAEYALPLLKIGGVAVLYRGHWQEEETEALAEAVFPLGGSLLEVEAFTTPITNSQRHCIYISKEEETPSEFPRPVGIPTQHPL